MGKLRAGPNFWLLLTSCMIQDKRHGFNPTLITEQDLGGVRRKGLYRAPAFSFFIRLEGYPADNFQATCATASLPESFSSGPNMEYC